MQLDQFLSDFDKLFSVFLLFSSCIHVDKQWSDRAIRKKWTEPPTFDAILFWHSNVTINIWSRSPTTPQSPLAEGYAPPANSKLNRSRPSSLKIHRQSGRTSENPQVQKNNLSISHRRSQSCRRPRASRPTELKMVSTIDPGKFYISLFFKGMQMLLKQ